jgi:hypothetical protein
MHAMQVDDLAHPTWVQFGGLRFVLATIGFGGWLGLLPPWVAAPACVLLVASAFAPPGNTHVKAGVFVYLFFFAIAGQPFNQGWGLLAAPLWAVGYGVGALGLLTLIRQARSPSSGTAGASSLAGGA